jgi:hypothetical protein
MEVGRSHIFGRQRNRAHYPVDNPSDYCSISPYLVFLDHLVEEISKRVGSNEERFCFVVSPLPAKPKGTIVLGSVRPSIRPSH